MNILMKFLKNEDGATAIEYGLIAALIAVALIVGAGSLGMSIVDLFSGSGSKIEAVFQNN